MMSRNILQVVGALLLGLSGWAAAQHYPDRPIRIVVPQAAGGSMDTNARAMSEYIVREIGQNIVIENRGGANGILAGEMVARASHNGYTVLYTSNSIINNQLVHAKPPFDVLKDFAPLTNVGKLPGYLILVNAQVPVQSFKELLDLGKNAATPFRYGSGGMGNSQHLLGQLINSKTGTKFLHVPYKGLPIAALLSNEIQLVFAAPTTVMAHIKTGRIKALAVTSAKRWNGLPDVPATSEVIPDFVYEAAWHGMFAPAGTNRAILMKLQGEVAKAIRIPKLREHFENGGYSVVGDTPEEFRRFLETDLKNVREHMRIAEFKPE